MRAKRCPECSSTAVIKYGTARSWKHVGGKRVKQMKQRYQCNDCGRQFRDSLPVR